MHLRTTMHHLDYSVAAILADAAIAISPPDRSAALVRKACSPSPQPEERPLDLPGGPQWSIQKWNIQTWTFLVVNFWSSSVQSFSYELYFCFHVQRTFESQWLGRSFLAVFSTHLLVFPWLLLIKGKPYLEFMIYLLEAPSFKQETIHTIVTRTILAATELVAASLATVATALLTVEQMDSLRTISVGASAMPTPSVVNTL